MSVSEKYPARRLRFRNLRGFRPKKSYNERAKRKPAESATIHAGSTAAVFQASFADHTFVFTHDGNNEINFPCWGNTRRDLSKCSGYGDLELAIAIACFDPFDRRGNYDDYAGIFPGKDRFFGDCSGIRYGITGVCHQMSNRIMHAMEPKKEDGKDVYPIVRSFTPSYPASYWAYGDYGTDDGVSWFAYLAECQNRVNIGRNPKGDAIVVTAEQVKEELLRRAENMDAFSRESIRLEVEHEGDENLPDLRLKLLIDTAFPQGYDSGKIKAMTEKDVALRTKNPELPSAPESEILTKQDMLDYADRINRLFADRLTSIHSIVGGEDFKKIFGVEYCADFALIDKQIIEVAE